MSDQPTKEETSPSWNWLGQTRITEDPSTGNPDHSTSVTSHGTAALDEGPKRPLLHNRHLLQERTKLKTISSANKRLKSVKTNTEAVEQFSALSITNRTVAAEVLRQEMKGRKFIKLQLMDRVPKETFTNRKIDWVTIGVIVRKTLSKPAVNGSTFMVWGLSDLDGTELGLFLFGDAYGTHWQEPTGSIVALLNATLLPSSEKNKFAFKATQAMEIVVLGKAKDFGICKATTSGNARCRLAINTAKTQYCFHHLAAHFIEAGRARQQLNNSMGTLRKTLFIGQTKAKNLSAGVYASKSSECGWNPIVARKRKRHDAAADELAVPTLLSASGAVVQQRKMQFDRLAVNGKDPRENRRAPLSLMDQLRHPPASTKSKRGQSHLDSAPATRISSRAQKIMSAVLTGDQKALKPSRVKKVNMMQFMNTGAHGNK